MNKPTQSKHSRAYDQMIGAALANAKEARKCAYGTCSARIYSSAAFHAASNAAWQATQVMAGR